MLGIAIFLLYTALHINGAVVPIDENKPNICTTESCTHEASRMLASMNDSVNPCEDFYEFACGKTLLSENKYSETVFLEVTLETIGQMAKLFKKQPQPNEPKFLKLAKIFNQTCMDAATLNEKGK